MSATASDRGRADARRSHHHSRALGPYRGVRRIRTVGYVTTGDATITDVEGLDQLIQMLRSRGHQTWGPVERQGAIGPAPISVAADLPVGCHDRQQPGSYELHHDDDDPELFGWAVGPGSWKARLLPASQNVWVAPPGGPVTVGRPPDGDAATTLAMVGVRPCELAAMSVLDHVLADAAVPDPDYLQRRSGTWVIVAECTRPAETCFCSSMGTGPAVDSGYDVALTELPGGRSGEPRPGEPHAEGAGAADLGHRFLLRAGSERGAQLLQQLGTTRAAGDADWDERERALEQARRVMVRSVDPQEARDLLARSIDHPRWEAVAERCLACGNCTMVCPTCFCTDLRDGSDLQAMTYRTRTWASCFDPDHSNLHGGPVRRSTASRYRQWLTHKLSTWWDQFGSSGCVGCGRCITWCPVGIDLTEEVAAIRAEQDAGESADRDADRDADRAREVPQP